MERLSQVMCPLTMMDPLPLEMGYLVQTVVGPLSIVGPPVSIPRRSRRSRSLSPHMQRSYSRSRSPKRPLPDELEDVFRENKLCRFCETLENVKTASTGEIVSVICESCKIRISSRERNKCPYGSVVCLRRRYVNDMGRLAAVCKNCDKIRKVEHRKSQQKSSTDE